MKPNNLGTERCWVPFVDPTCSFEEAVVNRRVAEKVMKELAAMDAKLGSISVTIDAMPTCGDREALVDKLADLLAAQNGMIRFIGRAHGDLDPDQ